MPRPTDAFLVLGSSHPPRSSAVGAPWTSTPLVAALDQARRHALGRRHRGRRSDRRRHRLRHGRRARSGDGGRDRLDPAESPSTPTAATARCSPPRGRAPRRIAPRDCSASARALRLRFGDLRRRPRLRVARGHQPTATSPPPAQRSATKPAATCAVKASTRPAPPSSGSSARRPAAARAIGTADHRPRRRLNGEPTFVRLDRPLPSAAARPTSSAATGSAHRRRRRGPVRARRPACPPTTRPQSSGTSPRRPAARRRRVLSPGYDNRAGR